MVATNQLRLKCAQVHHQSPAGTFTRVPGRCLRWSPTSPGPWWSPALIRYINKISRQRSFTSVQTFHTHTLLKAGWGPENEVKVRMKTRMRVRWTWRWNGKLGECKEQTPTPTHLAGRGQTLKGQEKRKAEADGNGTKPADRGEDRSAWTNLPWRNLSLPQHAQDPTYIRKEPHTRNRGPNGELVDETVRKNRSGLIGIQFLDTRWCVTPSTGR